MVLSGRGEPWDAFSQLKAPDTRKGTRVTSGGDTRVVGGKETRGGGGG